MVASGNEMTALRNHMPLGFKETARNDFLYASAKLIFDS